MGTIKWKNKKKKKEKKTKKELKEPDDYEGPCLKLEKGSKLSSEEIKKARADRKQKKSKTSKQEQLGKNQKPTQIILRQYIKIL